MPGDDAARYATRAQAGQELGRRLAALHLPQPLVYALPRGGVPVAVEIAQALGAPLDLVLVRKIGAPFQPELALGAVVDGDTPELVLNPDIVAATGADEAFIAAARARELAEIERRRELYLAGRARAEPRGRSVVVADDGLATGATARAALRALRRRNPARLVLAVPVAPSDTLATLRGEADMVVCLREARFFRGVGGFYDDFHQLSDSEVVSLLDAAGRRAGGGAQRG